MEVDPQQATSQQDEDLHDSLPTQSSPHDLNAVRGPPGSMNGDFDPSSILSSSDGPFSFESQKDFQTYKGHVELKFKSLQRMFQELKTLANLSGQKADSSFNDIQTIKKTLASLPHLQKMVASQTDKNIALKKELSDASKANNLKIEELKKKIEDAMLDITTLRQKIEALERKVETSARSSGTPSGGAPLPDNIMQVIDAFERQLGMYDVRIAEMDLRFQVLENTSYNGVLVWKIKDYARRKREAVAGRSLSLYSQPFYTSRYGYKMCARIYLNGDGMGKGTHMSLFFVVMKGDYDPLLPWPFRQKVTLLLLDQGPDRKHLTDTFRPDPSSSSFKRPNSDMNIASGCPLFVAHNVVDGSSYVKEDTIFVRIQVDTSDLENF
uniref:TNF receptor-associated factor 3 n=1 Tax=Phallusia mammillata TaxID=59560 RepID=A0A6F9DVZ5_9ASCI|nr:TNF receptor-associated factor 3 [Phallusia mammillata]